MPPDTQEANLGEISLSVGNHADILVMDNTGEYTGFDPKKAAVTQQIPASLYETDTLGSDEAMNATAEVAHNIHIDQPQDGSYFITLTGLTGGGYNLIIRTFAEDGSAQPAIQSAGQVTPGEHIYLKLRYVSQPGGISSLVPLLH